MFSSFFSLKPKLPDQIHSIYLIKVDNERPWAENTGFGEALYSGLFYSPAPNLDYATYYPASNSTSEETQEGIIVWLPKGTEPPLKTFEELEPLVNRRNRVQSIYDLRDHKNGMYYDEDWRKVDRREKACLENLADSYINPFSGARM